jgi:hypothetical protein
MENALELDIHLISEYPGCKQIVDHLFKDICQRTKIKNESRLKETLKLVILNLWVSSKTGLPTKYSRVLTLLPADPIRKTSCQIRLDTRHRRTRHYGAGRTEKRIFR